MHLSCDCLNILIKSKSLNFSEGETYIVETFTNDSFFKEPIGFLSSCSTNIQVPSLVKEHESGLWRIIQCSNCNKSCYAFCKTLGLGSILARKDLEVDTNKINRLKQSELYSPIFKILIYQSEFSSDDEAGDKKLSLYPAVTSWLNEQTALAEERVKIYSEKEYAALDKLRKRAYKEQKVINRLEQECAKEKNKNDPITELSQQLQRSCVIENKRKRLITKKSSIEETSFDAEGVFLLDGFEGGHDGKHMTPEDSDSDGLENSPSYQPKRMCASARLAKSLPIPVPLFMEEKHQDDQSPGSPEVSTDNIAASMKALARSVYGDSIFGELPKPRFSTNL